MNMMEIETAARFAWPALEEVELPFGVLRYSRGIDRRSNSLSLNPHAEIETEVLIGAVESFFGHRDATPAVRLVRPHGRVPESLYEVDNALEVRGYEKQSPTLSMLLDLRNVVLPRSGSGNNSIESVDVGSWLQAWYALTAKHPEKMDVHRRLFEKSELQHRCLLSNSIQEGPVSSGMAVFDNLAVGLFGIATKREQRKKGYALDTMDSLLNWGISKGAKFAYLQVEESNHAAVSLYRKLGFKQTYSYWYRVGSKG